MGGEPCPVVLVHGWMSGPRVWKNLAPHLAAMSIPAWNFSYAMGEDTTLAHIAKSLTHFIGEERRKSSYNGPIDLVCHSMGTSVARYMLEIIDRERESGEVRQLIGLGPPSRGVSLAELFHDPVHGEWVTRSLSGVFLPEGKDPKRDVLVEEFRPGSRVMEELQSAGIRKETSYHFILTSNITHDPDFFPLFRGLTWSYLPDNGWEMTYEGDGIVPHRDSLLTGASYRILPTLPGPARCRPFSYCHVNMPRNPDVINCVKELLGTGIRVS